MEKYSANIYSIIQNKEKGFDITVTIYNENEFELLYDQNRDNPFDLNAKTYIININENELSFPGDSEIHEAMEVVHEYEYSNNLNPKLRRLWKTASLIDEIAFRLINSGVLSKISEDELSEND